MKQNLFRVMMLLMALTIFACREKIKGGDEITPTLKLSSYLVQTTGQYTVREIQMTSTRDWKVILPEEFKSWVKVIPMEGEASDKKITLKVVLQRSVEPNVRHGKFQVAFTDAEDPQTQEVDLTQGTELYLEKDSVACIAFCKAMNCENWINKFDFSKPIATWNFMAKDVSFGSSRQGVSLGVFDNSRRISTIWFAADNNLDGKVPAEFAEMTALTGLRIEGDINYKENVVIRRPKIENFIELVDMLSTLPNLVQVWLSGCDEGPAILPAKFNEFPMLNNLNLDYHTLVGIEEGFGLPFAQGLTLSYGQIEGDLNPKMFMMPNMAVMMLDHNNFTGHVTAEILSGKPNLLAMELAGNRFTGPFPPEIRQAALWGTMSENGSSAWAFCPQQDGYGFDPGTCQD